MVFPAGEITRVLVVQENPWKEYKQVEEVFSATQKEVDERKHLNDQYWYAFVFIHTGSICHPGHHVLFFLQDALPHWPRSLVCI
jgi:hypothetical protein